jgi:hypothetical protein
MKYLIFANNTNLIKSDGNNSILNSLNKEDIIVTLNHCLPLQTILYNIEHKNIYHFSRRSFNKKIPYSGLQIIDKIKHKFNKIFLYPHPEAIGSKQNKKKALNYINTETSFSISDFCHMPGFNKNQITKEARFFLSERYNKITNLSMGLISYLFIKQTKRESDQIYLINFTHTMNINKHNAEGEKDFFTQEKGSGLCQMIEL